MDYLLTVFLVATDILIEVLFFKTVFAKKRFSAKEMLLVVLLILIGLCSSLLFGKIVFVRLLINLTVNLFFIKMIFRESWKKTIVFTLIFYAIFLSLELVVMFIFQYSLNSEKAENLTNSGGAAVMEIICYLIMLLIILVISIIRKKTVISRLDIKGWIAFALYPLTTLVISIFMIYIPVDQISQTVFRIILGFVVCMLFLSIIQFFLLENVMQREYEIHSKQMLIDQAEHVNQMYRTLSEEREIHKARSHDYMNHLNTLLALAEGNDRDSEIDYLKDQIGEESERVDIIDTGDAVINAVLNIKYREAKRKGIVMPLMIDDLSDLKISESDIVTILSNILDNAIEAADQCDIKKIVLQISKEDEGKTLHIDSSNTYVGDIAVDKGRYTTKKDKENHGYGLSNIRYAVEKNKGECIIDAKDGIFRIVITIPL